MLSFLFIFGPKVNSTEIVISSGPSFSVLLHCNLIFSEVILTKFKFFISLIQLWDILHSSGLESLILLECALEVHPVLGGVIMFFLENKWSMNVFLTLL